MKTKSVYDIRRENMRQLVKEWGGPLALSMKLGYANASYIVQLAGPHPTREISEKTARGVEERLALSAGWMDVEHKGRAVTINETQVAHVVRAVAAVLEDAKVDLAPSPFGEIVALVYEHSQLVGRIDEDYIKRLVSLCSK